MLRVCRPLHWVEVPTYVSLRGSLRGRLRRLHMVLAVRIRHTWSRREFPPKRKRLCKNAFPAVEAVDGNKMIRPSQ
jgi:hypothetical protein